MNHMTIHLHFFIEIWKRSRAQKLPWFVPVAGPPSVCVPSANWPSANWPSSRCMQREGNGNC